MSKTRVLVIDDSALIRQLLTEIINEAPDLMVIDTAPDPIFAMQKIKNLNPDVLTLDVEMPRMDGITFLEELMRVHPMPVVMVSALTQKGKEATFRAMELGAVDYVTKPTIDLKNGVAGMASEIVAKVRQAARAKVRAGTVRVSAGTAKPPSISGGLGQIKTTDKIIAIGASTGGTQALAEIIPALPENLPGMVVTQHMPPEYTGAFANRLHSISRVDVREARDGDRILRGTVLIAPGAKHMSVRRVGAMYYASITDGPLVNYVKPSVDVLFNSIAKCAGTNSMGVILTGMGEDGARGLKVMRDSGARTLAQDEATSIVFGMPMRAIEMGGAEKVVPLDQIADEIIRSMANT